MRLCLAPPERYKFVGLSTTVHLPQGPASKLQNIRQMPEVSIREFLFDEKYPCLEALVAEHGAIVEIREPQQH